MREEHSGHGQEVYENTFRGHVREVVKPPIGQDGTFVQIWESEVLKLQSEITERNLNKDKQTGGSVPATACRTSCLCSICVLFCFFGWKPVV